MQKYKATFDPSGYKPDDVPRRPTPKAGAVVKLRILEDQTELRDSAAGNPMLQLHCEVADGDSEGYWMWYYLVLNNQYTNQNIGRLFAALGWPTDKPRAIDPRQMIGKVIEAKVKHETKDGETKARIAYFIPKKAAQMPEDGPEKAGDGEYTPDADNQSSGDPEGISAPEMEETDQKPDNLPF